VAWSRCPVCFELGQGCAPPSPLRPGRGACARRGAPPEGPLHPGPGGGRVGVRLPASSVCSEGPFRAAPCHAGRVRETRRPPPMDAPRSAARRLPMGRCSPRQRGGFSPPVGPRWPWCLPRPSGVHRSLHRLPSGPPSGPPRERPLRQRPRRRRRAKVARRGTRRTAPSRPSTARRKCSGSRVSCNSTTPASRCR